MIDTDGTTETIRYQIDNHLGSASLELDQNAATISYEEYHPFGTTSYRSGRYEVEVSLKRYKYVGKERDEETGLYYYGARYYASWIGRWTAVDPILKFHNGFMGNSEEDERNELIQFFKMTPYNYVENRPIISTDPAGRKPKVYSTGNGFYYFMNTDKISDQMSIFGGIMPFGALAEPVANLLTGFSNIETDKAREVYNTI